MLILGVVFLGFYVPPSHQPAYGAVKKVLFDNAHLQTAGNADWTITGGYSDFAEALRQQGYQVDQFGSDDPRRAEHDSDPDITPDVLQGYDVLIIPEPNDPFTPEEQQAILDFIQNGGAVFFIADHNASDRNGNGWDSPAIFNGWHKNEHDVYSTTIYSDDWVAHLGFRFLYIQKSQDPITDINHDHPATEGVNAIGAWAGTGIAVLDSSRVTVLVRFSDGTPYAVAGTYGSGRFVAIGDSSPFDDGTGTPGDNLYDGWHDLDDAQFAISVVNWLAGGGGSLPVVTITSPEDGAVVSGTVTITATASDSDGEVVSMAVLVDGSTLTEVSGSEVTAYWNADEAEPGGHTIKVIATDNDGLKGSDQVTVYRQMEVSGDTLLLVDDSEDLNIRAVYTSVLDSLGVTYQLIDASDGIPAGVSLANYPYVVWFTGQRWSGVLTDDERNAIAEYLSAGGNMAIFGPDLPYGSYKESWGDWLSQYFGGSYGGGWNDGELTTIGAGPFDFVTTADSGNGWMNKVSTEYPAAYYDFGTAQVAAGSYIADPYMAVLFGFGLEQIPENDRATVMSQVLQFLGVGEGGGVQPTPTLTIISPEDGATVSSELYVEFYTTEDSSTITVDGDVVATESGSGTHTLTVSVVSYPEGEHTLSVLSGSLEDSRIFYIYRGEPPQVQIISPEDGTSTTATVVLLSFAVSDPDGDYTLSYIYTDGVLTATTSGADYEGYVTLQTTGWHILKVVAVDQWEHTASASVSVFVQPAGGGEVCQSVTLPVGWSNVALTVSTTQTLGEIFGTTVWRLEGSAWYNATGDVPVPGAAYTVKMTSTQTIVVCGLPLGRVGHLSVSGSGWFSFGVATSGPKAGDVKGIDASGAQHSPGSVWMLWGSVMTLKAGGDELEPGRGYFVKFAEPVEEIRW